MKWINRRHEGEVLHPGLNWTKDEASTIVLVLKVWIFVLYFRIRSLYIMSKGPQRKYIWGLDWRSNQSVHEDFDRRALHIRGQLVSFTQLEDLVDSGVIKPDELI